MNPGIIKEYYNPKIKKLLDGCLECGDCLYNCNFQLWGNSRKDAIRMVKEANNLLKGKIVSKEFKHKLLLCSLAGECTLHCKQKLDRKAANLYSRVIIKKPIRVIKSVPTRYSSFKKNKKTFFRYFFKFNKHDKQWYKNQTKITKINPDVLIYYGCWGQKNPKIGRKLEVILEKAGITWEALGGYSNCCGGFALDRGMDKDFDTQIHILKEKIIKINPATVLTLCGHCFQSLKYLKKRYIKDLFIAHPGEYITRFLQDKNMPDSDIVCTINDSCRFKYIRGEDSPLVEMMNKLGGHKKLRHEGKHALCCGAVSLPYSKELINKQNNRRLYELVDADIDCLVGVCHNCVQIYKSHKKIKKEYDVKLMIELIFEKLNLKLKDEKIKKKGSRQWALFYSMMVYGSSLSLIISFFCIIFLSSLNKLWWILPLSFIGGLFISFGFYLFGKIIFRNFFTDFYKQSEEFLKKKLPELPPMSSSNEIDQINDTFRSIIHFLKEDIDKVTREEREKNKIESVFGKYVDPRIISKYYNDSQNKYYEKELFILVADIRGFTRFSEKIEPVKVVEFLNLYFELMTTVIINEKGMIDRLVGDEIRAVFGMFNEISKEQYAKVINTGLKMQEKFRILKKKAKELDLPEIGLGIGISFGNTIMGNVGTKEKINFTFWGNPVVKASMNCDKAKDGKIIIPGWMKNA